MVCDKCNKQEAEDNKKKCSGCLEKCKLASRKWYSKVGKEYSLKRSRKYYKSEKTVQARRDALKLRRKEIRLQILNKYGPICICCGETNIEFLTLDHVKGDGHKERDEDITKYRRVARDPVDRDRYQILCYNCNCARWKHNGICPHKFTTI